MAVRRTNGRDERTRAMCRNSVTRQLLSRRLNLPQQPSTASTIILNSVNVDIYILTFDLFHKAFPLQADDFLGTVFIYELEVGLHFSCAVLIGIFVSLRSRSVRWTRSWLPVSCLILRLHDTTGC